MSNLPHAVLRRARRIRDLFGASGQVYDIRDRFYSVDAAPLVSPRTCEPGPGILTIADSGNALGIPVGGEIVPVAATAGNNNPGIYHTAGFSRSAGRAFKARVKNVSTFGVDANKTFSPVVGWAETAGETNLANIEGVSFWIVNTKFQVFDSIAAANATTLVDNAADTYYDVGVVLRGAGGAFHVVDNELIFVTRRSVDANVHPNIMSLGVSRNTYGVTYFAEGPLGGPWASDYGIATDRLAGARSVNDTFTHEGNCHIEFLITALPSAGNISISCRRQDANNYVQILIGSTGNLAVNEVIAGTPNTRLSLASNLVNDYIMLSLNGLRTSLYRDRSTGHTGPSAYNLMGFGSATSGKIDSLGTGGGISDLVTWPFQLSGSAKSRLASL